jgi:rhamnogalacturonan endolyase
MGLRHLITNKMIILTWLFYLLTIFLPTETSVNTEMQLAFCDFSRLTPGRFGDFAAKGFPEYHYVPRQFTDGWEIVNNRGPEEWKVLESDGKHSLCYLGYNETEWTHEFTYPLLCYGDSLWRDYTLEVLLSPLSRNDLNGIIFRYRDGRHYYLFGLDKGDKVTLRYRDGEKGFRRDGWHDLSSASFPTDPSKSYKLRVETSGTRIRCLIDDREIFNISDNRYFGGKVGLMANSPVAFHEVRVSATQQAREEFLILKTAREKEVEELRHNNPRPLLWKRISTKGFGVARAMRLGDLNNDGRPDFLLVQNMPFFNSNYNQITCLTALDYDGRMLWQSGTPDAEHAWVSYDVAAQIHDLDGDGLNEVVLAQGPWIRVLEGSTGKEKARYPVPSSEILPDEKSWLEYKHYYRRDLLPWLNVDCISFADLRGTGKAHDMIIKDRHTRLWAYTNNFELLWTASANLGHFPFFFDSDKDGKDEVYIGYSKFSPDGKLIWSLDSQMGEHSDGICAGDFSTAGGPEKVFIGGSDDGVLLLDGTGRILKHHLVGHAQTPSAGQFRPDFPGLEFCNINFWGEPGLITLYSSSGDEITRFELIHSGSPVQPVNWKGDGTEFIFLSPNPTEGGLVDGWGRRVVMFPDDGHPDLAWMATDMTGDPRDELIVWDTESIYIYTQDRPCKESSIYAPKRPPLYNESNYSPVVSWPAWK